MESLFIKDKELKELSEMIREYEEQIKVLGDKVMNQEEYLKERDAEHMDREQQLTQDLIDSKSILQDFILVRDELEKLTETLINKLLEREPNTIEQTMENQKSIQEYKEQIRDMKLTDALKREIFEMSELTTVFREMDALY